jgi:hypothetical protein
VNRFYSIYILFLLIRNLFIMLDLTTIQAIAQSCQPQELFAALVWQRRFNHFNGKEVITDLVHSPHLWRSFLFSKSILSSDHESLTFNGLVDSLLVMANYCPTPETYLVDFVRYPADTLYILAEKQDQRVAQLLELGKKWRSDAIEVYGGDLAEDGGFAQDVSQHLRRKLWGNFFGKAKDAVIVTYWWK